MRALAPRASGRRGFTLIELMVAMTGGLFFTIFVFMFTRDVSRFFVRESRMSDTTLASITGFQRLRADIARAGFLASPNFGKDPGRCPRSVDGTAASGLTGSGWAANPALRSMGLLTIDVGGSVSGNEQAWNGPLTPDQLTLYGNYSSSEQFPIRNVSAAAGGYTISLEPASGPMVRLGYVPATSPASLLSSVFPTGHALRLQTPEGEEQYGIITGVTAGAQPTVTLGVALPLAWKSSGICGIRGFCSGCQVNTVNIVRYRLDDLSNATNFPQFQFLYAGSRPPSDAARRELIRVPVLPTGVEDTANVELVSEYAVDLKFGLSVVTNLVTRALTTYPEGSADLVKYASDPLTSPGSDLNNGPQLIRGVHARLAVRSVEPDRQGAIAASDNVGGGLYRVRLTDGLTPNQFARVRTLQALIATRNTRNSLWN